MQTAADQVRWVPMEEIETPEAGWMDDAPDGPVLVAQRADGTYRLLSGSGRLRHMREAGQRCADVIVSPCNRLEKQASALLDRLVRGDIHYLDEAEGYHQLLSSGLWDVQQLSARMGRTPQTIRRKMRLLTLGEEAAQHLRQHRLCERYAQALLRIPGQQGRLRVLHHVTEGHLSVKETEQLIDDLLSRMPVPMTGGARMKPLMRDYRLYLNAIRGIVEQMADAGVEARMQVTIGRHVAEAKITIPIFSKTAK